MQSNNIINNNSEIIPNMLVNRREDNVNSSGNVPNLKPNQFQYFNNRLNMKSNNKRTVNLKILNLMKNSSSSSSWKLKRILSSAVCPICAELVREAFLTPCGHTFCHACVNRHLKKSSTCPQCNTYVTADKLIPNRLISLLIDDVRNSLIDEGKVVSHLR